MDSERSSFSSCASSSMSAESSSPPSSESAVADRMEMETVETDRLEMEAAEALADLAHLAMRENRSGDSGGKWGSKGKRGKKRVKSESPPVDQFPELVPSYPDLAPDPVVALRQHDEPSCSDIVTKHANLEQHGDVPQPSPVPVKTHPPCGAGRSRQNLTEAEKEERKLRRILANRESARQTIRRRQALCEELTRKAADLGWENESLKREKESVLKEFQSLVLKNKHLKEQMAKLIKTEVEESPADLKPGPVVRPNNSATNCPFLLYNQHPFSAVCWPSIIQSPNPVQSHHGPRSAILVPSNVSMPPNGTLDSSQRQHENPMIANGSRTPLYIVPCPWFFSAHGNEGGLQPEPSFGWKNTQAGTSVNNPCSSTSSSKGATLIENQLTPPSRKVKSEAASSAEARVINDLNEIPAGFPPDGGGQCSGAHSKENVLTRVTVSCTTTAVAVKNENGLPSEFLSGVDDVCTKSRQLISDLPGKNNDLYKLPCKKQVDAAAAAKARRRRKELTKLKNLHSRQCRMNC